MCHTNYENRRPDNTHADAEAEGMALVNFIFAKPFAKKFGKGN
jgi:hypothetical protein